MTTKFTKFYKILKKQEHLEGLGKDDNIVGCRYMKRQPLL
jgi:hypothetical protein